MDIEQLKYKLLGVEFGSEIPEMIMNGAEINTMFKFNCSDE